ncbi:MAG: hypothetical protein OXC28_25560 [Defluviicoccus sp.]|nr:hypothetical protein [Defluviicoccus sp.]
MNADVKNPVIEPLRGIARTTLTQLAAGDWIRQALNLVRQRIVEGIDAKQGSSADRRELALGHPPPEIPNDDLQRELSSRITTCASGTPLTGATNFCEDSET